MEVKARFDLIIDVGGTNIDIYEWSIREESYNRVTVVASPRTSETLYSQLRQIYKSHRAKDILVGLPGPIRNQRQEECWCFPLGYNVEKSRLENEGCDVQWCNDTEGLAVVVAMSRARVPEGSRGAAGVLKPDVILTLGTSFGYCSLYYDQDNDMVISCRSSEFAHVRTITSDRIDKMINRYGLDHLGRLMSRKYEGVLSGKGWKYVRDNYELLREEVASAGENIERLESPELLYAWMIGELLVPLAILGKPYTRRIMLHGGVTEMLDEDGWMMVRRGCQRDHPEVKIFSSQLAC